MPNQPLPPRPHPASRVVTWLTWWVLMMSLWVALDDSLRSDELIAGAIAAAIAAEAAELVGHQASTRYQARARWLGSALRLPGQVATQTAQVFAVLARVLTGRQPPPRGEFRAIGVRYGDDTPLDMTRRVLLTGARSLAPNAFVLGLDGDRDVMVVHELVPPADRASR